MIGNKVKLLRQSLGLSQSELARQSNLTSAAISKLEGVGTEPAFSTIEKIANAMHVKIEEFASDRVISFGDHFTFIRKFSIIKNLSEEDQQLILNIAKRLAK
jgi:transcriptional regulator with XRE-family HTH domain